ncbi:MAG: hypothetical protein ACXWNR_03990 [Candidatus Limnocylindrales bacterium]
MKRFVVACVLAGLVAAAAAPAALACGTRIPVSEVETTISVSSPGVTTSDGIVLSVRGLVQVNTDASTSAFLAGTSTGVVNYDVVIATGIGHIWGTDTAWPTAYPHGHWACLWSGTIANHTWTAKGSCEGRGTLRPWRYTADLVPVDATNVAATGYIFHIGH